MNIQRAYGFKPTQELNNDQLLRLAPSVFAEDKHGCTSARYQYIPTIQIVDEMRLHGWMPTLAAETKVRDLSRVGFGKHMIRFRHRDQMNVPAIVGDSVAELVLLNAHDGTSSYQLHAGLYRFVCANGMIVSDSTLEAIKVRHSGNIIDEVIEGTYSIINDTPKMIEQVEKFNDIQLSRDEQLAFASAAIPLRWDADKTTVPIEPDQLIRPRRQADRKTDLWTTFNTVQENMIRGGLRGVDAKNQTRKTRGVNSVNENARLNKALWQLSDKMAELKKA